MGKGSQGDNAFIQRRNAHRIDLDNRVPAEKRDYTLEELSQYDGSNKDKALLIAISGNVYDITRWARQHPGGMLVTQYAGEEATDAFRAMHPDLSLPEKYMKTYLVGKLVGEKVPPHIADFRELRKQAEKEGLFKGSKLFFFGMLAHILVLEAIGWWIMTTWSSSWLAWFVGCVFLGSAQAQAGWLQHDFGHLSVFESSTLNHWVHKFVICFLKAASAGWWNYRHYRHHAKPNIPIKDPDVTLPYVFMLGDNPARRWAAKKKNWWMPYQFQHLYYFILGPPMLLPTYFHYENLRFVFLKKEWADLTLMIGFFIRYMYMFAGTFGVFGTFAIYFFMRSLESHWFVWVTQMNHIPMEIDADAHRDWLMIQAVATCNVKPSWFNDWFTGHLNYQLEHHLFPTMPRHNYGKIYERVRALCKKHKVPYISKTLIEAMIDVPKSLQRYGQIWYEAHATTS